MPDTIYDEVRYSNFPYAQTHPDRLATVAVLHGIEPPDPFSARVLEIGCGAGGNLLAMAAATPGLHVVGVDLAASPIAEAQLAAREAGLANAEFHRADVRGLTNGELGRFDFVIAHGVYGWMPAEADDALLATIKASLTPDGIAYVSFNAQPGGYFRRMLRDVGLWHARREEGPLAKAARAQQLFDFLLEHRAGPSDAYGALLARELPSVTHAPTYRLVHDDLGEHWTPRWFGEFAEHAAGHGLGYVGEADLFSLRTEMLPEGVEELVWELAEGDRIAFETYSDLLTTRHFRQCVISHAGRPVEREPSPERAQRLYWATLPNAEPLEVGLTADAFAVLEPRRPRAAGRARARVSRRWRAGRRAGAASSSRWPTSSCTWRIRRLVPSSGCWTARATGRRSGPTWPPRPASSWARRTWSATSSSWPGCSCSNRRCCSPPSSSPSSSRSSSSSRGR
jgi:SAM-dependent methyltransferase